MEQEDNLLVVVKAMTHQECITARKFYVPNNTDSKYVKQNLIADQRAIEESTRKWEMLTYHSKINKSNIYKNVDVED